MNKKKILKELGEKFEELKKEFELKTDLEELDSVFGIKNYILREGFVSDNLSEQICSKIVEFFSGASNYIHSLIMPNPQNLMNISEAKLFNDEEKKEFNKLISVYMERSSKKSLNELEDNQEKKAKFIDESLEIWKNSFEKELIKIMLKVNNAWNDKK